MLCTSRVNRKIDMLHCLPHAKVKCLELNGKNIVVYYDWIS